MEFKIIKLASYFEIKDFFGIFDDLIVSFSFNIQIKLSSKIFFSFQYFLNFYESCSKWCCNLSKKWILMRYFAMFLRFECYYFVFLVSFVYFKRTLKLKNAAVNEMLVKKFNMWSSFYLLCQTNRIAFNVSPFPAYVCHWQMIFHITLR